MIIVEQDELITGDTSSKQSAVSDSKTRQCNYLICPREMLNTTSAPRRAAGSSSSAHPPPCSGGPRGRARSLLPRWKTLFHTLIHWDSRLPTAVKISLVSWGSNATWWSLTTCCSPTWVKCGPIIRGLFQDSM